MKEKLAAFWNSLPHPVQAGTVLFLGTVGAAVASAVETPSACMLPSCWGRYLVAGLKVGVAAVAGLYLKSSFYNR